MHFIPKIVVVVCTVLHAVHSEDFYCSRGSVTRISGQNEGRILTRYIGKSFYEDNQLCEWQVDAGPGQRIHITVEESELQYSQQIANCDGYDHVEIKEEGTLVSWCGRTHPEVVNTRGRYMTVKFMSDDTTPFREKYKGAVMRFQTFDAAECPPNWRRSGDACFSRTLNRQNWIDAQTFCNYEQGNLASIASKEEYNFILNNFNFPDKTWIGLNDRSKPGTFTWIDEASTSALFSHIAEPSPREFRHCVAMDTEKNKLSAEDCERSEFAFLCKTSRGQPSRIYRIPQEGTDKGDDNDGRMLLLGLLVPAGILLVLVIAGICIYRKRDQLCHCRKSRSDQKRYEAPGEAGNRSGSATTQPSAPAMDVEGDRNAIPLSPPPFVPRSEQHVAPPTYEQSFSDPVMI